MKLTDIFSSDRPIMEMAYGGINNESSAPNIRGFWITDKGEFISCDYDNDKHHGDLLNNHFDLPSVRKTQNHFDWNIYEKNIVVALQHGWVRCSSSTRDINIQWVDPLSQETKKTLLKWISEYGKMFEVMHIDKPYSTGSDYYKEPTKFYAILKTLLEKQHKLKEYKIEKAEVGKNNREITIYKNPNYKEMQELYDKVLKTTEIRGLLDDSGILYVWKAYEANHDSVALSLGVKMKLRLYMDKPDRTIGYRPGDVLERPVLMSKELLTKYPMLARAIKPRTIREEFESPERFAELAKRCSNT
jgi:hypothetical protein